MFALPLMSKCSVWSQSKGCICIGFHTAPWIGGLKRCLSPECTLPSCGSRILSVLYSIVFSLYRVHSSIYRVFLSQSSQPVHQQSLARCWGWRTGVAHCSKRKPSFGLPERLWTAPHPASFPQEPADLGGPPLHQEGDAAAQSIPHAQIHSL